SACRSWQLETTVADSSGKRFREAKKRQQREIKAERKRLRKEGLLGNDSSGLFAPGEMQREVIDTPSAPPPPSPAPQPPPEESGKPEPPQGGCLPSGSRCPLTPGGSATRRPPGAELGECALRAARTGRRAAAPGAALRPARA